MAKFDSYLLGKVSKTLGNVTMCYINKQNIARARIFSRKDKPTSEMLDQRARMKVMVQLSRILLPVAEQVAQFTEIGLSVASFDETDEYYYILLQRVGRKLGASVADAIY